MRSSYFAAALVLAVLLVSGCENGVIDGPSDALARGQLVVSSGERSRSILPTNGAVASYVATGSGPSGAAIAATTSNSGTFTFASLVAGAWTIVVQGLDSEGSTVASGAGTVTISGSATASLTVSLLPLSGGMGTLTLSATWPEGYQVSTVSGTMTLSGSATPSPITLSISGNGATYSDSNLLAGSYVLILHFKDGSGNNLAPPRVDTALIYGGKTSLGAFSLDAAEFQFKPVQTLSLSNGTATIPIGSILQLNSFASPASATQPGVSWSSSDVAVATVNASGLVTAVAAGMATITATAIDATNSATAGCLVTVVTPVAGITLSPTSLNLAVGASAALTPTIAPAGATNTVVTWSTSNAYVASVSASGVVTGVASGTITVTATTADGMLTAQSTVSVKTPVTSVSLSPPTLSFFTAAAGLPLAVSVAPSTANNRNVAWASSDTAVATVDSSGFVTPVAAGTSTITVTTSDGALTASSAVTVMAAPTPILLAPANGIPALTLADLSWNDIPSATSYQVQTASSSSGIGAGAITPAPGNSLAIATTGRMGNLYWRVRAVTASDSYGPWSSVSWFPMMGGTGPAGGLVFYDKGNTANGWQYMECAPTDQGSGAAQWSIGAGYIISTGTAIGTGASNTAAIIAQQGVGSYAASIAAGYTLGGMTDWFLPSLDEATTMKANLSGLAQAGTVLAAFALSNFWSSSQSSTYYAYISEYYAAHTSSVYPVRPVRTF